MKKAILKPLKILLTSIFLMTVLFAFGYKTINTAKADNYTYNSTKNGIQDYQYKLAIVRASKNPAYRVEYLKPLVGQSELAAFIRKNNENPQIYTPSSINIQTGAFRANLHTHTVNSDGSMTVEEMLNQAQNYANRLPDGQYMYIAITDHNTVLGAQDVIKVLQRNPYKYNKLKIIVGMEIYTAFNNPAKPNSPVEIHVLLWAINPYDEYLCQEFYKKNLNDKWNRRKPDRDFYTTIKTMKRYGIVGIAHPARYISHLGKSGYRNHIDNLFNTYKVAIGNEKIMFTEGYYQSYGNSVKNEFGEDYPYIRTYINDKARSLGIYKTGSLDTHGRSIFSK